MSSSGYSSEAVCIECMQITKECLHAQAGADWECAIVSCHASRSNEAISMRQFPGPQGQCLQAHAKAIAAPVQNKIKKAHPRELPQGLVYCGHSCACACTSLSPHCMHLQLSALSGHTMRISAGISQQSMVMIRADNSTPCHAYLLCGSVQSVICRQALRKSNCRGPWRSTPDT